MAMTAQFAFYAPNVGNSRVRIEHWGDI